MECNYLHIAQIIKKYNNDPKALIPILMNIQEEIAEKYISEEVAKYVSKQLNISSSHVYEVVTFFSALHEEPKGKYLIQLCNSTVCSLKKSHKIREVLESALGIKMGETTADKMFTLEYTTCFGACDISPAMRVNKKVYGYLNEEKVMSVIDGLRRKDNE
ncbi:complex I 24 kDa subunit family protein [Crassaminicella profunda]|uniref:NADH-quinone oxidoreductase subunit NuoE family protein n=1 Tax=Crassaminicella profunda TaxID=1286698 RepID=UPI001CA64BC1|nr:NAD(P)H-dependent oxidoreductase subunit E [Crassaminicella profunda]QZY53767.1 NAD(P)H-dependent oxidoreductase subunit E [Crassaminicella profunda]